MKQLFHSIDLQRYGAPTQAERTQAETTQAYAEQKLAETMVRHARKTANGEVVLNGTPILTHQSLIAALQDIRHFSRTDQHLQPDQLRALQTAPPQVEPPEEPGALNVTVDTTLTLYAL